MAKHDEQYMKMAQIWAESSYAKKLQVGSIIVKDRQIISDGYNGTISGFKNECEDENGKTYPWVLHAEANALSKLAQSNNSSTGATLYVTHAPCISCSKMIIQAGIKRVVFGQHYKRTDGLNLMIRAGLTVELLKI